ncbi:hypothetical protein Anas_01251, partial [Armadillidium nasatum]
MELLKHRTRANELEALVEIENLLVKKYGFKCKLITKKHIRRKLNSTGGAAHGRRIILLKSIFKTTEGE